MIYKNNTISSASSFWILGVGLQISLILSFFFSGTFSLFKFLYFVDMEIL